MNGKRFIMWTTEEGGVFQTTLGTREQYEDALVTGTLKLEQPWLDTDEPRLIDWFFIATGEVEHHWDKILGGPRD